MSIYDNVNTHLRHAPYRSEMPLPKSRGSPKGQSKPTKRSLDPEFPRRLKAAIAGVGLEVPEVAKRARCTRAVLWKYLGGNSKAIEALLLFDLAGVLNVSAEWLLKGAGAMAKAAALNPDEGRVLNTFNQLRDFETRDFWISQGEDLVRRQPALIATKEAPFRGYTPVSVHESDSSEYEREAKRSAEIRKRGQSAVKERK